MASFRRKVKKELKKPDEFFSVTSQVINFIEQNQKLVSNVLIAVIVISGMTAGYFYYRKSVLVSGEKDLYAASKELDVIGNDNIQKSIADLEKIAQGYSVAQIRGKAELELARLYLDSARYDSAKTEFEKVADSVGADSTLGSVAQFGLANTLIQQKKWGDAIEILKRMDEKNYPISKGEVYFALARAYREKGDSKNSLEYLKKLSNLYPDLLQNASIPEEAIEAYSKKIGPYNF